MLDEELRSKTLLCGIQEGNIYNLNLQREDVELQITLNRFTLLQLMFDQLFFKFGSGTKTV